MKNELQNQIAECNAELADISVKIDALSPLEKSQVYFTNYALMKACGTVEFVYKSIVADYFDRSSLTQVHTYIDKNVRQSSMSATYDNMSKLLGKFDDSWRDGFKNAVQIRPDCHKLIDSSKSLVNNRHLFAHGKPIIATFNEIKVYYQDVLILINILDSIVC